MLGALRKTTIGLGALGLLAAGLTMSPAPVQAAPGDEQVCVVATQPAEVYNLEYGDTGVGHDGQASMGTWVNSHGQTVKRYGLYYPVTDPAKDHAVPRQEQFGARPPIPATPLMTGDHFRFVQQGECANSKAEFDISGTAIGYCGRSVGMGAGKIEAQDGTSRNVFIRWESVATQLVMLDSSARGSVNAQPTPTDPTKGSCTSGTAITFLVDGSLVDTRPAP
jgi:hypothetical protein